MHALINIATRKAPTRTVTLGTVFVVYTARCLTPISRLRPGVGTKSEL